MSWIVFIALAAICNATQDTLAHHFSVSIFKGKNEKFWNPAVSWQVAKFIPFTKYKLDAWHIHKSVSLLFLFTAMLCYHYCPIWVSGIWWVDLLIMGASWDIPFNTFYNHILIRKKK
jgi:hypothetical protein